MGLLPGWLNGRPGMLAGWLGVWACFLASWDCWLVGFDGWLGPLCGWFFLRFVGWLDCLPFCLAGLACWLDLLTVSALRVAVLAG
jgi:hypothetical protein